MQRAHLLAGHTIATLHQDIGWGRECVVPGSHDGESHVDETEEDR
jgi:hypothetical protein